MRWPGWHRSQSIIGTASLAVANLVFSLLLLRYGSAAEFGSFAMLQISQGLAFGVSNALLGAPLLLFLKHPVHTDAGLRGFFAANLILILPCVLVQGAIALALGLQSSEAFWAMLMLCFGVIRWFGRHYCLSTQPESTVNSDLTTSALMLSSAILLWSQEQVSLLSALQFCAVAQAVGVLALGKRHFGLLANSPFNPQWRHVRVGVKRQGRPAFVGALSLEATANGHSYLISLLAGPAAFAPIAAAALLFRPTLVLQGAMAMYERPLLVRGVFHSIYADVYQSYTQLRQWALLSWFANLLLVAALVVWGEHGLWRQSEQSSMYLVLMLWSAIMLIRSVRLAPATLLQASDQFALLARICTLAAMFALPAVALLVVFSGAVSSLWALLVAELIILYPLLSGCRQQLASTAKKAEHRA
ncbi:hypothetical protein [Lacimicrobium alkaliphilum]|uniref:Polysaccharide biosynthesis protein n=1 Tax=Lacimicrobium alkaliphilum TaxID=1526571 RepID=A0ABQ1RPC7_9ALTE|nr:hypothetical protein [Lacimicrobium alkaliphilum]GGD76665.1 hypothetical protein GCM10011357_34630 [Lacimicrobium alkaliphilum]